MSMTDENLDNRLRAARIAAPELPAGAVALLARESRDRVRSRRIRAGYAGIAAVAAVGIGAATAGPAVASTVRAFLAQTGWVSAGTEVVPDSEFIDTAASDLPEYIDSILPTDFPLAPQQTRSAIINEVVGSQTPALRQEVGLRRDAERIIRAGWLSEWLSAHAAGDSARTTRAAEVLLESSSWPAFTATDGGGVMVQDAAFMRLIASGDAEAAQAFAQFDNAPFWDGTDRTTLINAILDDAEHDQ